MQRFYRSLPDSTFGKQKYSVRAFKCPNNLSPQFRVFFLPTKFLLRLPLFPMSLNAFTAFCIHMHSTEFHGVLSIAGLSTLIIACCRIFTFSKKWIHFESKAFILLLHVGCYLFLSLFFSISVFSFLNR